MLQRFLAEVGNAGNCAFDPKPKYDAGTQTSKTKRQVAAQDHASVNALSGQTICATALAELGEPRHAGITTLYRAHHMTILQFTWAPYIVVMPHNHQMFAAIGIYSGRGANIFWRRKEMTIEAASAKSLGAGDVVALGRDTIHSVLNQIGKMTSAIHIYRGDFFASNELRSEWEHETLVERPWDVERVKMVFREAEQRFNAVNM
jgi:predicted metal-dependent enzyme (double-stranded beta helix superfamily)